MVYNSNNTEKYLANSKNSGVTIHANANTNSNKNLLYKNDDRERENIFANNLNNYNSNAVDLNSVKINSKKNPQMNIDLNHNSNNNGNNSYKNSMTNFNNAYSSTNQAGNVGANIYFRDNTNINNSTSTNKLKSINEIKEKTKKTYGSVNNNNSNAYGSNTHKKR